MCGGGLSLPGFGVRMSVPGMRPYLQSGQQGGKVGQLLLECLLLFLVLAAAEQGMAQSLQDPRESSSPRHPKTLWEGGTALRQGSASGSSPLHSFQECLFPLGELLLQMTQPPCVLQPPQSLSPALAIPWAQGSMCRWLPRTCMRLKRELMAASSSLALLRTSSIMALSRTMASRVEVCSSFTACPGWWGGCSAGDSTAPPHHPHAPRPCPPSLPGPAAGSPACTQSQCRCSVPGSPCRHRHQRKAQDGAHGKRGAGTTHPCISLKQLMQSMDFFSVENMM